jgi:hypothetical protein
MGTETTINFSPTTTNVHFSAINLTDILSVVSDMNVQTYVLWIYAYFRKLSTKKHKTYISHNSGSPRIRLILVTQQNKRN